MQLRRNANWDLQVDFVSVGSSTGGLAAAILGHDLGLRVTLLESAAGLGGATAYSGGILWIPNNDHLKSLGIPDSREEALEHLRSTSKGRGVEENMSSFVDHAPEAARYLEEHSPLKLTVLRRLPDYRATLVGGKASGRILFPDPLTTAQLLQQAEKKQPVLSRIRLSPDVGSFFRLRGMPEITWIEGRALIGSLLLGCLERGIAVLTETRAQELIVDGDRVVGLLAVRGGADFLVKAERGVLLATGGYEWNQEMMRRFVPGPTAYPASPPSNRGEGHIMAMEIGAATALMDRALWSPAIHIPEETHDDKPMYRLVPEATNHPGSIIVNRQGRRFMNESFWPDFSRACVEHDSYTLEYFNFPMYWICDQSCRNKHPIGSLPAGTDVASWLHKASSLSELAYLLGISPDGLEGTVQAFNISAREGRDPEFGRGEIMLDRCLGDRDVKPNPALGALDTPPFYGVELLPGVGGHQGGLVTNGSAQVINVRGEVIRGLYACGNAAAHLAFGAGYNSGGAHSMSLVFGYIAAKHAASTGKITA